MANDDDEMLTVDEACAIVGGKTKPINRATYYRAVRRGDLPAPFHPTPGVARISKSALIEARARIINR